MKKVYFFRQRIFFGGVAEIISLPVWNAAGTEKRLHRIFKRRRFTMRPNKKPPVPPFAWHVKIGIADNVRERRKDISANIYGSGKTEWFVLTIPELAFAIAFLFWKSIEPLILVGFAFWAIARFFSH